MLIDTHAHLDYPDFEPDFDEMLARAISAGVTRILTIGTSVESSRRAVALAEKYSQIHAVVGIHPTSAEEAEPDCIPLLRELAQHPKVAAIGETGLDYYRLPSAEAEKSLSVSHALQAESPSDTEGAIRDGAYKAAQAALFSAQLELAAELGLNVVIHQRSSWEDTLEILRPFTGKLRAVFHCFGNSFEDAQELIDMGHMVSFTGIVTFKNGELVRQCAAQVPGNAYMVETDCPYLAPVPFRGKRCEPAHTRQVAETIAKVRGVTVEEISRQTTWNAQQFFRGL